ncbi:tryptophan-rich sensory protein [Microbacterium trichothecenolyticum]|uniref:Tryptophan-rich sensory protein n=1 Tax=Microbacterium ureisolvens TaxID=2781186 RepID=A0ABS7I0D6_9MICO|nr:MULTISPECIES: tryptophan-rich sensory protein [Microbacterium]MBW9111111.1 tryptophan-rich sensory protein [Microbacterium ureisolvens]MBW9122055.1 tryptophan-rich sensory protein [Microbacterium trichothecenolyticum]
MTGKDLARQIVVISAFCFMIVAAMVGTGLFGGTPVQDLQDGALDQDGSYLAPARPAFSIWTVIYVGLFAYTVWQALPRQRSSERQRVLGYLIAGTMALNGLWLVTAQFGSLALTVLAIIVLLALLGVTFSRTVLDPAEGWADRLLVDGVTGLHLGWVTLATVANIAAWLTSIGPPEWEASADLWGVVVLIVVGVIGLAIEALSRWRIAPALALAWGLVWLAVGRLAGEPHSTAIGVTAIVVAAVILGTAAIGTAAREVIALRNAEA